MVAQARSPATFLAKFNAYAGPLSDAGAERYERDRRADPHAEVRRDVTVPRGRRRGRRRGDARVGRRVENGSIAAFDRIADPRRYHSRVREWREYRRADDSQAERNFLHRRPPSSRTDLLRRS